MVFSRFFKDKSAPAKPEPAADDAEPEADAAGDDESDETDPEHLAETPFHERAAAIMPTGTSTGSKRPSALYGDADIDEPYGPTHYRTAAGCHIETVDGATLLDCTMALGSVALGYADPQVTRAALEAVGSGNISALPSMYEIEAAERFCEFVPCAEKVQFLKTGAEAVAAAVRIARAYTNRDVVVGCGYFGWHDWSTTAPGVPAATRQNYRSVPFDDIAALESAVSAAGDQLAAIILEPVIERLPSVEWLEKARALCDARGAVLVFDEIKTGFRVATGGYQEVSGVTPDLATFGKALANGFPLAAVCGRTPLMNTLQRTWVSSTLAAESSALAAAIAVIEIHREEKVCDNLAAIGKEMRRVVDVAITSSGLSGVSTDGIDPMWFLRFASPEAEARFLRASAKHGVLFKRGAYNFACLAHDEEAIHDIEAGASTALVEVRRAMEHA